MKRLQITNLLLSSALSLILSAMATDVVSARDLRSINDGWMFRQGVDTASVGVHLPHSWNGDAYSTRDYFRGSGVYTRQLTVPADMEGKRILLKFDGAASKSAVSIDGKIVGTHTGAYLPHIVDVTSRITPGATHALAVEVDNSDADIPPYSADFTFMGGLYRDAWLISQPELHFSIVEGPDCGFKACAKIDDNHTGSLTVAAAIVNDSPKKRKTSVTFRLYNPANELIAQKSEKLAIASGATAPVDMHFNDLRNVELWSPESPSLYLVTAEISDGAGVIEQTECHTAFRSFGFDSQGRFLLNGEPYKLRGMCRHQDQRPTGIALTDEQHRRDMELIKEMGANFIRISHYPQDDAVLEMCDRLGLIAWEEIPVIDYVPESEAFANNCETMLREMIRRHYNHPSVAMWGYMNEILLRVPGENRPQTIERTLNLARRLEEVAASEDSTRLTTMAFHGSDVYNETGLADITDVKGWNLYQGWYGGRFPDFEAFLSRQHRDHPDHRLIVSEYGAGSDLRLHSLAPETFDFSMEYQQDYLEHYLPVIEDSVFIAGASHWNFIDFSSANRAESMPHINNKGLVTNDRRKKDVYHYYRASWTDIPADTVAHIAVRDWPERTELIDETGFVVRPVKVYTNLPSVSLRVNGETAGEVVEVENSKAVFSVSLRPGKNLLELFTADGRNLLDVAEINLKGISLNGGKIDTGTGEFAVNVGSNCYFRSDESGLTWLPDREYTPDGLYGHIGGERAVSQDEISLTPDQPLLQRSIVGLDGYRIDVVPGRYEVELTFVDLSSPSALSAYMLGRNAGSSGKGLTEMDVAINGKQVERDFSPARAAGVKTMVKRRYTTRVDADGSLNVGFVPSDGAVTSLSAIKIRKL